MRTSEAIDETIADGETGESDGDSEPLPSPAELAAEQPLTSAAARTIAEARRAIRRLVHGEDRRRLLVVAGPCSIHDAKAALEYAHRLRAVAERTRDELVLVMRAYVEKPRTTVGWKGLVNDPALDGSCDVALGLRTARAIVVAIAEAGVACGSEILEPATAPYLADVLAWGAIGARTAESQTHRVVASGLPFPVGVKNRTDGDVEPAVDALATIAAPHAAIGIGADGRVSRVRTRGNPDRHLVLRGGRSGPNASAADVSRAAGLGRAIGIARAVMVDCSHANSGKIPARQSKVAREVLGAVAAGETGVLGLMLESHLVGGRQEVVAGGALAYGVSVTDPCLGWAETEELLTEIAWTSRRISSRRPTTTAG